MSQPIHSIVTDIEIAEISQYLSINANSKGKIFRGGNIDERLPVMLYMERKALQWINGINPNDSYIVSVGNYVFDLCGPYQPQAQRILGISPCSPPIIITQPISQAINSGDNVTFSVVASGTAPLSYQWYFNSGAIGGATNAYYIITGATGANAGNYYCIVSNNCENMQTLTATLTVNVVALTGFGYYTDTDPDSTLQAHSDPFSYQESYPITHNAPISAPILQAGSNNKFWVFKWPSTESAKTIWVNAFQNGNIPDSVFRSTVSFGGFIYYYTRNASSFDFTVPITFS